MDTVQEECVSQIRVRLGWAYSRSPCLTSSTVLWVTWTLRTQRPTSSTSRLLTTRSILHSWAGNSCGFQTGTSSMNWMLFGVKCCNRHVWLTFLTFLKPWPCRIKFLDQDRLLGWCTRWGSCRCTRLLLPSLPKASWQSIVVEQFGGPIPNSLTSWTNMHSSRSHLMQLQWNLSGEVFRSSMVFLVPRVQWLDWHKGF